MSLLQRAMGSISREGDATPTGPANAGNRRQSGGQGGARGSPYARPSGDSWKHDKYDEQATKAPAASAPQAGSLASRLGGATPAASGRGSRSARLIIKDLHYEVSERELELLFVQIGPIATGPKIKFDKSGRSTGMAWISYTTEEHGQQAKEAFDGALAKGQNIKVEYDFRPERIQPAPGSLLARLEPNPASSRGPRNGAASSSVRGGRPHVGPQRGVGAASAGADSRPPRGVGGAGGPRGARGGAAAGGGRGGKVRREPKTNDDLDKELEAFMKSPEAAEKPTSTTTQAAAPAAETSGDVEMS
ncbi:hypothetical protein JCM11491_005387 [Sporobolomyces phaffii]